MPWPQLAFETTRNGDEVSLAVAGELDLATAPALEQTTMALLHERPRRLVLDLHQLTFCDSSGITSLIRIKRATAEAGSTLQLARVDGRVREVLDLGGVSEFLGVSDAPPST